MKWIIRLLLGALFWIPASAANACAVDGVAGITETTIAISWDVSRCKRLSAGATFRVCYKKQGDAGNACLPPTIDGYGETGTTTITGLSPSTAYRIRTLYHTRSNWWDVTTRIVTTHAAFGSSQFILSYVKGQGQKYCVDFSTTGLALPPIWTLTMVVDHRGAVGGWNYDRKLSPTVSTSYVSHGTSSVVYTATQCNFSENQEYQATLNASNGVQSSFVSNTVQWK